MPIVVLIPGTLRFSAAAGKVTFELVGNTRSCLKSWDSAPPASEGAWTAGCPAAPAPVGAAKDSQVLIFFQLS